MDLVGNFSQGQQVVATEVFGGLPSISVLIDATKFHAEAGVAGFGFVSPDGTLNSAKPDLMCWFICHSCYLFRFAVFSRTQFSKSLNIYWGRLVFMRRTAPGGLAGWRWVIRRLTTRTSGAVLGRS